MAISIAARKKYKEAVRKLFPQGPYWEKQFADSQSDVSLFCEAKLDELLRFLERKSALHDESMPESTDELLADWERVLLGEVSPGLDHDVRRALLLSRQNEKLNRSELEKVVNQYGLSLADVSLPYLPFFLGHSGLGSGLGDFRFFSVVRIKIVPVDDDMEITDEIKYAFEASIVKKLLANQTPFFVYGGA